MADSEHAKEIVYISCLDEVRYSFASHLSEALLRKGINDVFVDSDDLLSKESQAIVETAMVSVIILPGHLKPTTEFLEKLLQVFDCKRHDDQMVVPVLYGIITLDEEWRLKLHRMNGLSQYHESREGCSDSELVKEIAIDVYVKLFYKGKIGIYSKLLEIEKMVCNQPLGNRCLGIWGMPGIGKSTLAKAFLDQKSGEFDAHCFIEDYEKIIHEKGLYRLLEEQFLKEKTSVGGTVTKLSLLKEKLNNQRVLVVLDDVRTPLAAESFLRGFSLFGSKSLIIITSRDKQLFRFCQVNQIYEVQGLNQEEALQLFFSCASIKNMPQQNLVELSERVINYANGNPLALNIYGKEIKGKRKLSEMETAFDKLKRRPPYKIVDALKTSYDTLSDTEKNIFLDIACFFRGENVDYVMPLLEGCGFFPEVGIDVLVDKCLVTISERRVCMHNLIHDVGREIINGETVQIERRSRLWEPWSIKYLLEDNEHKENNGEPKTTPKRAQGIEEIEGMFLDTSNLSFDVKPNAFKNMLKLRLLKTYCSNPETYPLINFPKGIPCFLPNALRLLHWENYSLESLPQNFDPRHLVEINMPYSQLEKLWGGTKNLEMLRTIRLCHSKQLVDVGDLSKAQNLEVIDLQGCTKLRNFPATSQLLHLQIVNLSGCIEIKKIPVVPPNIETLQLQGTGIIELPLSIVKPNGGELASFLAEIKGLSDALKLERLTSLQSSYSSSQELSKLNCLELKDCYCLRSLPDMVNLELIKVLDLSGCSELETIQGFPPNLKEVYLASTAVRDVPQLPQSVEVFNAHGCASLTSIPLGAENLPTHCTFSNCFNIPPQVVNNFLVKALDNVKQMPSERKQELKEALTFSLCVPSHAKQDSKLDLLPRSSVMIQLNPSQQNTLVGFVMRVEVAFSKNYIDSTGFGISSVCRWKNKKGSSHMIKINFHCWAPRTAVPKVEKDHMFVFYDVKMRPSGDDIWGDLVVFEFFPVDKHIKPLDDSCRVIRCGVSVITAATDDTSLKNILPALSLDSMDFSGNEVEKVLRASYEGLQKTDKALFLYIACLFNDEEDVGLVAPLIPSIDSDVSSGLKVLANKSLIRVSSEGEIVMHCLLRQMGKEILHRQSMMLPSSSKDLTIDFEKAFPTSFPSPNSKYDVYLSFKWDDVVGDFISRLIEALEHRRITTFKVSALEMGQSISELVQVIRGSKISVVALSENYASSSWLLNELVEIAKSNEELSQITIPIYYDVDPLDVRNQTGEFGRQFEQTCKNKTEDEKQRWCRALAYIPYINGFNINKGDSTATSFINEVVEKVQKSLVYIPTQEKAEIPQPENDSTSSVVRPLVESFPREFSRLLIPTKEKADQIRQPEIASSPSSTAFVVRPLAPQVFINFRGEDVRKDFIGFLGESLTRKNVNFFMDTKEYRGLRLNQLFVRIQESRIALAIISEGYTNSTWCLDELEKIMECEAEGKLNVIPIFYKIPVSTVKNLSGTFGEHFKKMKEHHDLEKIEKWEKALVSITEFFCITWPENSHKSGSDVVNEIVEQVQRLLDHISNTERTDHTPQTEANRPSTMIYANKLNIKWSEDARYWTFVSIPGAPNEGSIEVAKINTAWWFNVSGFFHTKDLNLIPGTQYEVVFVVKVEDTLSGWDTPAKLQLVVPGGNEMLRDLIFDGYVKNEWVDIQAGVFMAPEQSKKITFKLFQHETDEGKTGLQIKGVAIRPTK